MTIDEAFNGPESHFWIPAAEKEINSHVKNNTFSIVPRPQDRNIIKTKFAWKTKFPETENPIYKARLVAQGFSQAPGEDYSDTFSPVPKSTSIRLLFAHAAGNALHAHHFDVETAFLIPDLDRTIYCEQPPGFEDHRYPRKDYVLLINKGLYGLKQSALLWSNDVKSKLLKLGYKQSNADESIFILQSENDTTIVAVYVDDFLVLANTTQLIDNLNAQLSKSYTIRDLGPVKRFLGLDVHRPTPTGPIYISQSTYSRKVLHRFGMEKCNPAKTPFSNSSQLHRKTDDEEPANAQLYSEIIGSIGHLSNYTRPDLAFTVSKLSQYLSNPSIIHMQAAKHVLRYIQGTLDYGICFSTSSESPPDSFPISIPFGFSDASHAADPDDRKSHSGHAYFYYNGPIVWQSSKQQIVTLSSMESEFMELSEAAKEAIFLRKLLESLNVTINNPTMILTDSQSALNHVKNNVKHARTKHIDTRFHYIREVYTSNQVDLKHVPHTEQTADILTKPLGFIKHAEAIQLLKLTNFPYKTARSRI